MNGNQIKSSLQLAKLTETIKSDPGCVDMQPFPILDNIHYVGNRFVGAYLIDTGDGLLLIDSNFREVLPILLKNIRQAGYDPADISLLFLSHGHFDHIGGAAELQKLSGCRVFFPEGDHFMLTERRDLIFDEVEDFEIDEFFDYSRTYSFGEVTVRPVLTAGHTLGCTSLILTVSYRGRTVRVGVHGGLGLNGLSQAELAENRLPADTSLRYRESLMRVKDIPVDVFLPLHNSYYDIFSLAESDGGDHSVFIRPGDWKRTMEARLRAVDELIETEHSCLARA